MQGPSECLKHQTKSPLILAITWSLLPKLLLLFACMLILTVVLSFVLPVCVSCQSAPPSLLALWKKHLWPSSTVLCSAAAAQPSIVGCCIMYTCTAVQLMPKQFEVLFTSAMCVKQDHGATPCPASQMLLRYLLAHVPCSHVSAPKIVHMYPRAR